MPNALFVVTNHSELGTTGNKTGYYLPEAAHPYEILEKAGFEIDFVSPKGGKSPLDEGSKEIYNKDEICQRFLNNQKVQEKLENTLKPSQVDTKKYSIIFFVGGHGPMFDLPNNHEIQELVRKIYEENKESIVAAVCHGPVGIANVKLSNNRYLVEGKKVTGFTNAEEEAVKLTDQMPFLLENKLRGNGALFQAAVNWSPHVECDDRIFTGQNPASATPLAETIVKYFKK